MAETLRHPGLCNCTSLEAPLHHSLQHLLELCNLQPVQLHLALVTVGNSTFHCGTQAVLVLMMTVSPGI